MTCFDQQNLLEVILNEFWSLDLKRPHSFHSCPFAALTQLGEDARASLLEDETFEKTLMLGKIEGRSRRG